MRRITIITSILTALLWQLAFAASEQRHVPHRPGDSAHKDAQAPPLTKPLPHPQHSEPKLYAPGGAPVCPSCSYNYQYTWHNVKEPYYHNNFQCSLGLNIPPEYYRTGTGGKPLCYYCYRLSPQKL